jgi:glucose/arabinose dehydrogenase/VanZ family protein
VTRPPPVRVVYALAALGAALFIAYGSLVPFTFRARPRAEALHAFAWVLQNRAEVQSRSDALANVLLGLPLGFFALATLRVDRRGVLGTAAAALLVPVAAGLLAAAVEFGQLFVPGRTSSASDIRMQIAGAALGVLAWLALGRVVTHLLRAAWYDPRLGGHAGRRLAGYCLAVAVVQALPLDIDTSPHDLYRRLRDGVADGRLTLTPFGELAGPSRTAWALSTVALVGLFTPVGLLMATVPVRGGFVVALAAGLTLGVATELLQLVVTRHPSVTDAVVAALAVAAGRVAGHIALRGTRSRPKPIPRVLEPETPLRIPLIVALAAAFALPVATAFAEDAPKLPPPYATPSVAKFVKVVGWPEGKTPTAPPGFTVTLYADGFESPRWLHVLPNGDVLVAESNGKGKPKPKAPSKDEKKKDEGQKKSKAVRGQSADRITLLRDADGDGKPETREVFLSDLNQPFGMELIGDKLYVANTDAVAYFPYKPGQTKVAGDATTVLYLPLGGYNNHWTRNLLASPDGKKLYVTVGSASNAGERGMAEETLRANVLEMDPDGTSLRVFASGLRNPVGLGWEPTTKALWTAVNERDELGDELVPDYITSVQEGKFYGWPYSYFGQNVDPRRKGERPDLVAKAVVPDLALGAHTASLGLCFSTGKTFPAEFQGGAFVGQHGSWNRSTFSGYKVVYVPFKDGKPSGEPRDFLTGFLAGDGTAYGRPVCTTVAADGALLVTDDASNRVWRVAPTTPASK